MNGMGAIGKSIDTGKAIHCPSHFFNFFQGNIALWEFYVLLTIGRKRRTTNRQNSNFSVTVKAKIAERSLIALG
jgi:hypothetical protein